MHKIDVEISENLNNSLKNYINVITYRSKNNIVGSINVLSNSSENIFGYPAEKLKSNKKSILDIVYFEDKEIFENKLKNIPLNSKLELPELPSKLEYRIVCKDKSIKWVEDVFLPIRNDVGEIIQIEGYLVEISAIKQLQIVENTLSSFQDAINNASIVSITNVKGEIIYVNSNFCFYSKYNSNELIGENHNIVNSGKHDKLFFKTLWKTIKSGGIWRGEICNKAKDGSYYWVDTVITPVYNNHNIEHFLSIRNIITDTIGNL